MNTGLFVSRHALYAAAVVGALAVWPLLGGFESGPRGLDAAARTHLLTTGWIAAAAMVVACLYVLRKYAHKRRWSPELGMRVSAVALERAEARIGELRRQAGGHRAAELEQRARAILREEGVQRVLRARITHDLDAVHGRALPEIELEPTEPLGRMSTWLHAHVWWGLAAAALVWLHARGAMASPLGLGLEALTLVVTFTGILGLLLFARGPLWLIRAERRIGFEEGFVVASSLDQKLDELCAKIQDDPQTLAHVRAARKSGGGEVASRELEKATAERPEARALLQDAMVLLGQRSRVRAELARLARVRLLMNAWRLVHVPASIALMLALVLHVIQVWWY